MKDENLFDPAAQEAERLEVNRLIASIDTAKLEEYASSLRNGIKSKIPALQYDRTKRSSVMGGMNYHIEIRFDDAVVWLARIRRFNSTSPPPLLRDYIIRSEVATLKFLERTAVPAPKVYGYALATDDTNNVGTGYILMEKMTGRSFNKSKSSNTQLRKVVLQLSDIYVELSKYPFQLMGSLDHPGTTHVGSFARESLTDVNGPKTTAIGPCSSFEEFYTASIQLTLDLIIRREMYAEQAIDAYLIHRFLLDDVLPRISIRSSQEPQFFLKHPDDKGDHILVDDDYNITGIIDWEWSYTAPVELAFNSPIMLLPVARFYNGEQSICEEEEYFASCLKSKGTEQLAKAVKAGRIQHFFSFCCGYDLGDWTGFLGLFQGLRDAAGIDEDIAWDQWRMKALRRYESDEGLQFVLHSFDET
ncbi:Hypothetical protein R9X50_00011800 [Acrodontium crateriforme]|uniref:Aminoglycoside phosphotransferase domain-containing protein n=1 Tax=Acrodontium crateriforme TaxID=150365 RepID=A0AAQ3R6V5_9PEZI|nr:Hypothetical protein R9X50_00011800 [Acrodontium crateriforme]